MSTKKPIVLCVLDGWGISNTKEGNAVALAKTPVTDMLLRDFPHSRLDGSGEAVGLPGGQMGNSEVGHTNLGAGRIVYQDFTRISKAIREGDFFDNPALVQAMEAGRESAVHLMGLVSDGGVHSHVEHVRALIELARRQGVERVYVHAFTDGRDTPPTSGKGYLAALVEDMRKLGLGEIASITGRYFAMDRDRRWDRVEKAFRALTQGEGKAVSDPVAATDEAYAAGETDEFIQPRILVREGKPVGVIGPRDSVICFNFRPDRAREITLAVGSPDFDGFPRPHYTPPARYTMMTAYDKNYPFPVAYPPQGLTNILPEILAQHQLTQFRIAETEKYAHITFFFNGGREIEYPGEDRCLVPSPKEVATYDQKPEMSAYEVTDKLVDAVRSGRYDFVLVNYANHDMVGHTGNLEAAIQAAEAVDRCMGRLWEAVCDQDGVLLVTADHGNSEQMVDPHTHGPFTAHTTNLVHFILAGERVRQTGLRDGILADVAPTVLDLLGIPAPSEMTGRSLLVHAESGR